MLIEGRNSVGQALDGNGTVDKVLVFYGLKDEALIAKVKKSGVQYQFVDRPALDRVSKTKNHQGIVAFVTDYKYFDIDEVIEDAYRKGEQPIILILDGVEDPHNLGNIIRTAECMGVDGLILPKNRSVSVNDTAMRVSQGASSNLQICKVVNINNEIEKLKRRGFWIYAVELGGGEIAKVNLRGPIAFILGGEGAGVHQLTRKLADGIVSIKMRGKINSLNVGSACAMALYEANRQRDAAGSA
ncbi:MAG: 23S rRNA (guanosine(2251)-2'-O)-methyltransferase RlmB [Christensenellaceae bacterium]|nr:23S rRNA (guanosine(2251)-2'-O)-methyltransferase RlmB [Christensenellaceae bacterium]